MQGRYESALQGVDEITSKCSVVLQSHYWNTYVATVTDTITEAFVTWNLFWGDDTDKEVDVWCMRVTDAAFYAQSL